MAGYTEKSYGKIKDALNDLHESQKAVIEESKNDIGNKEEQATATEKVAETTDSLNEKLTDLKKALGGTEIGTQAFKDLQKEIADTQAKLDDAE